MKLWRLSRKAYLSRVLSGQGAARHGGRWTSRGVPVVYAAESLELALLEAIVHLDIDVMPADYWQICFEVDDALIATGPKRLPKGWDAPPPYRPAVQKLGDAWVRSGASLGWRVPASVLPERSNVLLNPAHAAISEVREISRAPLVWPARLMAHLAALREQKD